MSAAGVEPGLPPGEHGAGPQAEIATLVFNDGSKYTGTLKNGTPHGLGTCVWRDGNQYDGEWRNGVMHGFGTYLWTSGQRYDGEWKDGKRDGVGVKMYADGSTFHGIWRDGKKHGVGVFKPAAKEKDGRRAALIKTNSGRLLPSIEGDSVSNIRVYESLQHTTPETPQHADLHAKESTGGAAEASAAAAGAAAGTSTAGAGAAAGAGAGAGAASGGGAGGRSSSDGGAERKERDREKEKEAREKEARDRDKEREKEKEKEKEREREGKLVFIRAFDDGVLAREDKLSSEDAKMIFGQPDKDRDKEDKERTPRARKASKKVKRALGFGKKLQQKHGQLLYKGMPGYNLMLRLQHGIRWSVGRGTLGQDAAGHVTQTPPPAPGAGGLGTPLPLSHVLKPSDFTQKVKVFFPSAGSHITPAHPAGDFKWKDYSPAVFRNLRNMYGITDADYMLSLGGSSALWQLNSPGKSGCMFFLSDDERFLVKTMRKTEIRTLIDMLPKYYSYMESQPANLVIRFFGVHGVKQVHGRTVRFVVMHNMFNTDLQIHKKFDLKGSTEGRTTGPRVPPNDPKTVFKDLDLDLQFLVEPQTHAMLIRQISNDAEFLRSVEVMDYSLLLGIHFCSRARLAAEGDSAIGHGHAGGPEDAPSAGSGTGLGPGPSPGPGSGSGPGGALGPGPGGLRQSSGGGGVNPPPPAQPHALGLTLESGPSHDAEDIPGQRVSPNTGRNGSVPSPAGHVARPTPGEEDGEHVTSRNFDLFYDRPDLEKQLRTYEERMRGMAYGEQRIKDILDLARLRILGDQLKKRSKKAYKVYDGPATVLKALASRRHGADSMPRVAEEAEEAASDEEEEPLPLKQPACMGYQMRALAVHSRDSQPPEEVILCFGIIDILQDWNPRKVFERTFKSVTHDSYAISVAPPKLYSIRFAEFLNKAVFLDPAVAAAKGLHLPPPSASMYAYPYGYAPGVATIEEEEHSEASGRVRPSR
ncbi:hypothetical protein HYH03_014014 [Edaphochlamys debaryana]|uniref:1-phosphatidylinositol-4-phosphate 5-kinase n=1 Tax=Edaphochlamys debaryana TaxID=47281 RepID=A0A835XQ08_9CHLO|nr:hypothetical protein HYH03_014014 [Edaphochlamys debaryana]|eukprot:KAG2487447.1 hypothetical protein HYH03_014014 [Edaphochlamys debaryana]